MCEWLNRPIIRPVGRVTHKGGLKKGVREMQRFLMWTLLLVAIAAFTAAYIVAVKP